MSTSANKINASNGFKEAASWTAFLTTLFMGTVFLEWLLIVSTIAIWCGFEIMHQMDSELKRDNVHVVGIVYEKQK